LIYCTLMNPALDVIYKLSEFHSGITITDVRTSIVPAGKGINVARVVKTLGEDVCVVGLMPELDMKKTSDYLQNFGISFHFTPVPGSLRVNTTILESAANCISHINSEGVSLPLRIQEEFAAFQKSHIKDEDLWCFSGSVPRGFDDDIYGRMLRACAESGTGALLDSRGNALKFGLRSKPLMIKPNLAELEDFFDEQIKGVHHIALKGKRLIDMGISYVFISLGADGMIAIHDNDCLLCSAPQVRTVDTVGCGDALVAGLLVGYSRKFSFSEMCRMAVACGTSKAMHEGPGVVTRDEVWQLMEDVQITAV
jgi:1-phosphofructokinase family hexose kinase